MRPCRTEGIAGLEDHSCRPHRSPRQAPGPQVERICRLRQDRGWGPHRIGWHLDIARSSVYAVLRRAGLHRLCTELPARSSVTSTAAPANCCTRT